ncbi:MAG: gamma-glutamyltransferase [Candidatus Zixiibacteriota bacterium]
MKRSLHTATHIAVAVMYLAATLLIWACDGVSVTHYYTRGMVVTVSPPASEIGRHVIEGGGNAFDAAVAVGFALAVTYPQAGNIGGGGFATIRHGASGEIAVLDFRETAPAGATREMFLDSTGEVVEGRSTRGALAAGVPGTVAGLYALWEKYGTMKWSDLVGAAARLADTGFTVDSILATDFVRHRDRLSVFATTRQLYLPNGVTPSAGGRWQQPELAHSLYAIAEEGPAAFYTGVIADSIVSCMSQYGGLISYSDLERYRPVWREPLHYRFDSLDIYSVPPPSSGGVIVGQILKLLEPFEFSKFSPNSPDYIHLFCEASRLAFADRSEHLGDPAFFDVPASLLDSAYLDVRRALISRDHASASEDIGAGNPRKYESGQTTHYSICDSEGNMVAVTTTINESFGSGLVVVGGGFLLNNEMDDFAIKPGYANVYGLVGNEANAVAPGKRMLSSMSPTLVMRNDRPFLILGSPGGSKIITTVAQAIINFTRFNLPLKETVRRPRFHHQWLPDEVYLEQGGYDVATIQRLIRYGHQVREGSPYGDLKAIYIGPTGMMTGVSDWRCGGLAAGCKEPIVK